MPVHRATTSAISSSVTSSRRRRLPPWRRASISSSPCELALELGQAPVTQLRHPVEVVAALGLLDLAPHFLDLLAQGLDLLDGRPLGLPLGAHGVGLGPQVGELAPERLEAVAAGRVLSLLSAASSTSSRVTRRVTWSSSCGIESISVRITAQASSTRSMALSGRKRSLM